MSTPESPGIVLADDLSDPLMELRTAATSRFLHAKRLLDMGSGRPEVRTPREHADYILEGGEVSRFVGLRMDGHGLQASMLAFTSADFPGSVPPISEVVRQSEETLAGKLGVLTCVDFFSIPMGSVDKSPVQLVGAETLAGDERIEDLLGTLQNPGLEELRKRVDVVRYAPAAVVLVEAAAQARSWADRYFVSRKLPEVVELAPEGTAIRCQLEEGAASIKKRLIGNGQ